MAVTTSHRLMPSSVHFFALSLLFSIWDDGFLQASSDGICYAHSRKPRGTRALAIQTAPRTSSASAMNVSATMATTMVTTIATNLSGTEMRRARPGAGVSVSRMS